MSGWRKTLISSLWLTVVAITLSGCAANMHNVKTEEPAKYILGDNATDARYFYTRSGCSIRAK